MSTSNLLLPLDPTGSAASNLITNEPYAIGPTGTRAFPLNYGLFFRDSLSLVDVATNRPLVKGTQYYATQMDVDTSSAFGQEVDAVVIITDPTVSANIKATYQAVGGENSLSITATQSAIAGLAINDAAATWAIVQGKPKTYPPAPHVHQAGDVFGTEYIVGALTRLGSAITEGQGGAQAALLQYAEDVVAELVGLIGSGNAALLAHTGNFNNPHHTSAAEVGAYTTEQTLAAVGLEATNRQAADTAVSALLTTHIANHNNPHDLLPSQLGAYTQAQSNSAMTAMQTAVLASVAANEVTQNTHITNYLNPHQVTAIQIGTWTTPQITAAITTATNTLEAQVLAFQNSLQAHEASTSNPHGDTVANIGTWSFTSIDQNIINPYVAHVNNISDPHGDWYGDIVTSNVDSSGVYSATAMNNEIAAVEASFAGSINSVNGTFASHTGNMGNPHGDNYSNTGGAYTAGQLQTAINQLQGPGGSAANAINYLASIHN